MRYGIFLALLIAGSGAEAATLAPDSLVCESVTDLEFVARQDNLRGQPASVILKRSAATVEFYRLDAQTARMMYVPKAQSEQVQRADADAYKSIVAGCATASGPAAVLERKPISGLSKVKITYRGQPAELWTESARISE
jgi:hypothetical protein